MSTEFVSKSQWRFVLVLAGLVLFGGLVLVIALALGVANPPRAGALQWQINNVDDLPTTLPPAPFTLEITAKNTGAADSAWGMWIGQWTALIRHDGYVSINRDRRKPNWTEFPHIRRNGENKLYLHVEVDGQGTLRINDEIAWTGILPAIRHRWGVAGEVEWKNIALYY